MSERANWSFTDHQGREFTVLASNEREACQKANEVASARDRGGIDGLLDDPDVKGLAGLLSERPRYGGVQSQAIDGPSSDLELSGIGKPWEGQGETRTTTATETGQRRGLGCGEVFVIVAVVFGLLGYMAFWAN